MEKLFYQAGIALLIVSLIMYMTGLMQIAKGFILLWFTGWLIWQKERLDICNECAPGRDTCPECKCFKEPKVKIKSEICPLNKW